MTEFLAALGNRTRQKVLPSSDADTSSGQEVPPNDGLDERGPFLFMMVFFGIWNSACAGMCQGAYVRIFRGDPWGFGQFLLTCLIPHVAIGFALPLMMCNGGQTPQALLFLWPHGVALFNAYAEAAEERRVFEARRVLPPPVVTANAVLAGASNPLPSLRRAMSHPFAPTFPERYLAAKEQLSADTAECPICFEALCVKPVAGFMSHICGGVRVCAHLVHLECCESLLASGFKKCPLCRAQFACAERLPQVGEDDEKWFKLVDVANNRRLSQREIEFAFRAILPLSTEEISRRLHRVNGGQEVDLPTFKSRVAPIVTSFWGESAAPSASASATPAFESAPESFEQRRRLFACWDADGSGILTSAEVVRGCVKSKWIAEGGGCTDDHRIYCAFAMWGTDGISEEEFVQPQGFLEELCTQLGVALPGVPARHVRIPVAAEPSAQIEQPFLPTTVAQSSTLSLSRTTSRSTGRALRNLLLGAAVGSVVAFVFAVIIALQD